MAIYRVDYFKTSNSKYVMVEANSKREAINKAIEEKRNLLGGYKRGASYAF